MRTPAAFCCLLMLAAAAPLGAAPAPASQESGGWQSADPAARPIAWRQNTFSIPFKINRPENAADAPVEVRLFVSTDRGQNWELAQTAQPAAGRFLFRAPRDGEYWFSLRTVDRRGRVLPEAPHRGGLRVAIDTLPPRLDLQGRLGEAGQVEVAWQSADPHLDPDSLKIEYQAEPNGPWKPLALAPRDPRASPRQRVGEASWWPENPQGAITVRGEIFDAAGNRAVSQAQVALARPAAAPSTANLPSHRYAVARPTADAKAPAAPEPAARPAVPFSRQIIPGTGNDPYDAAAQPWPVDRIARRPLGGQSLADDPFAHRSPAPAAQGEPPSGQPPRLGARPALPTPQAPRPLGGGMFRPISQVYPQLESNATAEAVEPRMVNARAFELEYGIEAVGSAGVSKVELWGTRDQGRTWTLYATDRDNRSPVQVEVTDEGLYGFRIVVEAGNGLGGQPPQSGDAPEIWIGVDLTRPQVQLISALSGTGNQADHLIIKWSATDESLDPRPIALSYVVEPGEPWQTIASGLENTGGYAWRLPADVPEEIYLRVEARDKAGNTAEYVATRPTRIYRPRPQGHIRGVRPVKPSAPAELPR